MIFKNAHINVAPSGYLLEVFTTAGYRVTRIPNPFDAAEFPFTERKTIHPRLLWVRSFTSIYNPEMALRVASNLKNDFPDLALCMVGPDKNGLLERMKSEAENLKINAIFTGRLSKPEWALRSKNYDIFINTAHIDNMPFSIIEAASLGMVIVSTNVGGIPHLLEDRKTALLVNDNDDAAMADAVREILSDNPLAQQLLDNARRLVGQSEWNSVKAKWLEILV
jgi:glycosyltransferase involved in cell wall biosynthesis